MNKWKSIERKKLQKCNCEDFPNIVRSDDNVVYFDIVIRDHDYQMFCPSCGTWIAVAVPKYIPYEQRPDYLKVLARKISDKHPSPAVFYNNKLVGVRK